MAEQKNNNRERIKEIVAGIEDHIKELFQSDQYLDYLRTMSRFHKYSYNNTLLIHMQRPDATLVCGFNKWRDTFKRHVKKGERGITIIAPTPFKKKVEEMKLDPDTNAPMLDEDGNVIMDEKTVEIPLFRPVKVFDYAQTEGEPLPELVSDLTGNVEQYEIFMEALRRTSPVPIGFKPLSKNMDGFFSPDKQSITIREGMSEVQTVCATIHEIAHSILHNRQRDMLVDGAGAVEPPQAIDRETEEIQAESVAFAVSQFYSIDTTPNSIGYIGTWSKGQDLSALKKSLDIISKTVNRLITNIDRHYAEICKEHGMDSPARSEKPARESSRQKRADPKMVYKMEANPLTTGAGDRFFVQAYEVTEKQTLIPGDVLFYGSAAKCAEVRDKLEAGALNAHDVREQYIRDHPPGAEPDTPERFTTDLCVHLDTLRENGIQVPSVHRDLKTHILKCLKTGKFDSLRDILKATAEQTGTPNSPLMERLENLCERWEAALVYKVIPAFQDIDVDHATVNSYYEADGALSEYEAVFAGTKAHCEELAGKLNDRTISAEEVRKMMSDPWPDMSKPKETEQAVEPDEALYLVDGAVYIHIQKTDGGVDYTLYDGESFRQMDGGQIDIEGQVSFKEARSKVFKEQELKPKIVEHVSLDMLETLVNAQFETVDSVGPHYVEMVEDSLKEDEKLWDTVLDKYPMPDGSMTLESLKENGYPGEDLLAVTPQKAAELFDRDFTLYAVTYESPALVFDADEIKEFTPGVLYAIPREEWEASPDFKQAIADRMTRQEERETAFLRHAEDCFAIYQLRDGDETRDLRYEPLPGQGVDKKFYELVYTGELAEQDVGGSISGTLENLFRRFNMEHPADYQHPSMSVSDIVALKQDGMVSCHYVDRYAFSELHGFLPQGELQEKSETHTEAAKEGPSVAELEAQVKAGLPISLLDLANAVQREQDGKKSVREKLRRQSDTKESKKPAPKKSAERGR